MPNRDDFVTIEHPDLGADQRTSVPRGSLKSLAKRGWVEVEDPSRPSLNVAAVADDPQVAAAVREATQRRQAPAPAAPAADPPQEG